MSTAETARQPPGSAPAPPTVTIIGGYGRAGIATARLLLKHFAAIELRLCGRHGDRARATAQELHREAADRGVGADVRVEGLEVDAARIGDLDRALAGADVVLLAMPARCGVELVVDAAIRHGAHYIDLSPDEHKYEVLPVFDGRLRAKGLVALMDAGVLPGCALVLVRLAAAKLGAVRSVRLGSRMKDPEMAAGGGLDMLAHSREPFELYRAGRWRERSIFAARWISFGQSYGKSLALPLRLAELHDWPARAQVRDLALYQASVNGLLDAFIFLWRLLPNALVSRMQGVGVRVFRWLNRTFTRPPFGMILKVNARGRAGSFAARLCHEDVYTATAIPVVAAIEQVLGGRTDETGLQWMGEAIDPEAFVERLAELGMEVRQRGPRGRSGRKA